MFKAKLLIVDDDENTRRLAGSRLADHGFDVVTAANGEEGVTKAFSEKPDVIILSAKMPGLDGVDTCRRIREHLTTPIIFLGARSHAADRVACLNAGADNYLTTPLETLELIAHLNAAIRRQQLYSRIGSQTTVIRVKDLTLDVSAHELRRDGNTIPLTSTEFKLFRALAENAGRVVTRDQLLDKVWDTDQEGVFSRTVDVHIGRIRRKIGDDSVRPHYIFTVSGVGYKMPGTS